MTGAGVDRGAGGRSGSLPLSTGETDVIDAGAPRLRRIALLRPVPDAELRALETRCRWLRYRAGAPILDRQSESRDVLFVVEGSVRVVDYSLTSREIVYAVIRPGGHFGEFSAITAGRARPW